MALPQNIASKHRICTNMATKVKELGFTGDCGYNQLLYPVESQTRTLLNWLVQKLPRTDDASAEDVLGGNALLHKRMMDSVTAWKAVPWRLPFCMKGTKNYYYTRPAATVKKSLDSGMRAVYDTVGSTHGSVGTSVFELHARALAADFEYAHQLESEYDEGSSKQATRGRIIASAFASVKQSKATGAGRGGTSVSESKEAEQMTKSLAEIIAAISNDKEESGKQIKSLLWCIIVLQCAVLCCSSNFVLDAAKTKAGGRGTRFTHSTGVMNFTNINLSIADLSPKKYLN